MKKNKNSKATKDLESLANIGPATARRLCAIGITTASQLKKSDPEKVYEKLREQEGDLPPHFHGRYGEYKIVIDINSLRILDGDFPPRALGLIIEWASLHKADLLKDWELAAKNLPPQKIEPLK